MQERQLNITRTEFFDRPLQEVWDAISDTERLNVIAGTGFTPYVAEEVTQPDGRVLRRCSKRMGPMVWRWEERFGQWSDRRFIEIERFFTNGPYREMSVRINFIEDGNRTRVDFVYFGRWDNLLGEFLTRAGALNLITKELPAASRLLLEAPAKAGQIHQKRAKAARSAAKAPADRLRNVKSALELDPYAHGLSDRLLRYLDAADPLEVRRLRPLALAAEWGVARSEAIDLFLAAHRAGLLALRWEVMCPRCRGGKSQSVMLSDVPREVHCSSCNIDYERDFANNVELVFSPSPWYQKPEDEEFCLRSATTSQHVKLQCDVKPESPRAEQVFLSDGHYRIRTVEPGPEVEVTLYGGAVPEITITDNTLVLGDPAPQGTVQITNLDRQPRSVVIETTEWSTDALTGPAVIAMPAFRELCPEQLLRPGDDVEIGRVAILFTDLKGSTALFEEIGDSRAFALVRAHFAFLEERVRRHGGVVVKTIGDAVMAAFQESDAALAAALNMQDDVEAFNAAQEFGAIELKIGVHEGACIAVTTKGVLDYFGAAVNMAARLQAQAGGGEVVLSEVVSGADSVKSRLAARKTAEDEALLTGFSAPVRFLRVR